MDILDFIYALGKGVCTFLMTSPIYYFTGVIIMIFVGDLVRKIIN